MVHLFEDCNLCAIHAKRVTISASLPLSACVLLLSDTPLLSCSFPPLLCLLGAVIPTWQSCYLPLRFCPSVSNALLHQGIAQQAIPFLCFTRVWSAPRQCRRICSWRGASAAPSPACPRINRVKPAHPSFASHVCGRHCGSAQGFAAGAAHPRPHRRRVLLLTRGSRHCYPLPLMACW